MTALALFAVLTASLIPAIQTDLHRAVRRQRVRQIRAAIERVRQIRAAIEQLRHRGTITIRDTRGNQ